MFRTPGKFLRRALAERRMTHMSHKYVGGDQMAKACAVCAKTKIDFHPVIAAQQRGIERSDCGNALLPEIEAGTVDRRQRDALAVIRMRKERIERRRRIALRQRM